MMVAASKFKSSQVKYYAKLKKRWFCSHFEMFTWTIFGTMRCTLHTSLCLTLALSVAVTAGLHKLCFYLLFQIHLMQCATLVNNALCIYAVLHRVRRLQNGVPHISTVDTHVNNCDAIRIVCRMASYALVFALPLLFQKKKKNKHKLNKEETKTVNDNDQHRRKSEDAQLLCA